MFPPLAIRTFLQTLFEPLGLPYPPTSPREKAAITRLFQQRLESLYTYLEKAPSQDRIQRLFARFCGESTRQILWLDLQGPEKLQAPTSSTLDLLLDRPPISPTFDQLYCTPDSTERRVKRILEVTPPEGRVLFVGDDDLGSLLLSQTFRGEIHVIDLDDRLLSFLTSKAPSIRLHKLDLLLGGVPPWMFENFDTVILDPPWDLSGAWAFFSRALFCLQRSPHARILLAFCPVQMEMIGSQMRRFWTSLSRYGLTCEAIERAFHLYNLTPMASPDYLQAFHLRLPTVESPLMDLLQKVPYTFSNLYEIRRLQGASVHPLRLAFFRFWLRSRQTSPPAISAP